MIIINKTVFQNLHINFVYITNIDYILKIRLLGFFSFFVEFNFFENILINGTL